MVKEKAQQERSLREEYSRKGLNPDFLGDSDWFEKVRAEETRLDSGIFGSLKTRQKYAKILKDDIKKTPKSEDADLSPKEEQIYQKLVKKAENSHILDMTEDSEDLTEDFVHYYQELEDDFKEQGIDPQDYSGDSLYDLYKDREKMKALRLKYHKKTQDQMMEETLKLMSQMRIQGDQEQQIIFEKVSNEDYFKTEQIQHHHNKLRRSMEMDEEDDQTLNQMIYGDAQMEDFRDQWIKRKVNKK